MSDLCRVFSEAGCEEVRTVIQGGNVLFETPGGLTPPLERAILVGVRGLIGREAVIVFRAEEEVRKMAAESPFGETCPRSDAKRYVSFFAGRPRLSPRLPAASEKERLEVLGIRGLKAFVVSRRLKAGTFGFPNVLVEALFGVPDTTRHRTPAHPRRGRIRRLGT